MGCAVSAASGTKPEIYKQIAETYGEGAISRSRVYQWCTWFGEGRTSLGDEPKSGRPKTSTNEENTTRVDELIDGQCINAAQYCSTLDRLKEAIRRKRPGLFRKGVVLQHDNATPHSANLTQQWLQRYGWEIVPHPAHSPDLAPSDFHLFGPLKRYLRGMAFETEDDLISELRNWFDNLDVDFFRVGINSLLSRWQKCTDLHRDYVEK
ncbi:histone-lysine N-methyltransferase SETMAR [Plakobranchus ocellatus]|uniref:Histone-lysine N-methyltransferase SETMAR n=1 Tax=Plakobranchus ocellatus TaxID=259542 RepID=A0AAV3YGP9_9GAST|nr:histone-lysine N-methyltransferase SETMAR [Plakobranchus ocellatus]